MRRCDVAPMLILHVHATHLAYVGPFTHAPIDTGDSTDNEFHERELAQPSTDLNPHRWHP